MGSVYDAETRQQWWRAKQSACGELRKPTEKEIHDHELSGLKHTLDKARKHQAVAKENIEECHDAEPGPGIGGPNEPKKWASTYYWQGRIIEICEKRIEQMERASKNADPVRQTQKEEPNE